MAIFPLDLPSIFIAITWGIGSAARIQNCGIDTAKFANELRLPVFGVADAAGQKHGGAGAGEFLGSFDVVHRSSNGQISK
jgi:hypothetical protein